MLKYSEGTTNGWLYKFFNVIYFINLDISETKILFINEVGHKSNESCHQIYILEHWFLRPNVKNVEHYVAQNKD